jgi:MoxR-like ATPase
MASLDPFRHITIGYPKLAARIEVQPELSIYRRFGALNAQNLLYYQAELVDIEEKLRAQQVQDDNDATGEKSLYAKTWFRLKDSAVDGDTKQLDLVTCMRETLKEYSKY